MNMNITSSVFPKNHFTFSTRNLDLIHDMGIRVTTGCSLCLLGMLAIAKPLLTEIGFAVSLSILFACCALALTFLTTKQPHSVTSLIQAKGIRTVALSVISLLTASLLISQHTQTTLTYLTGASVLFFLVRESAAILKAVLRDEKAKFAQHSLDFTLTIAALLMFITGWQVNGEYVLTSVLGMKFVFAGCDWVLLMREEKGSCN
ncbi:hypothetical protein [Vibrio agarivorans]|uniref:hypothetical protein n=1 Tax=Vibrio agarivorans TaxID=153622 RepID=UPI0025B4B47A|nr:hypothetical protein [Vibrio agarivorans]MDN3660208.1 hypothetical protein [Vibrio agarivorans]